MNKIECPVCGNMIDSVMLHVKDHSVSNEFFDICQCVKCSYACTLPQPDPFDIGRYYETKSYVSHSETRKGIVNKLYHIVRRKNTKNKLSVVKRYAVNRDNLLDVGCGTGYFLSACLRKGWKVDGVEINDHARITAEGRTQQSLYPSVDKLLETGKRYDAITLWHVFEHFFDINTSLQQLKSLLNPDGVLIIALPNPVSYDAQYYKEFWAAYDVPRHLSHFTPVSFYHLTQKHGLKIKKIIPMKFDSYYISMLSEGLKGSGKIFSFLKGFCLGWKSNSKARKTQNYSSLIYIVKN